MQELLKSSHINMHLLFKFIRVYLFLFFSQNFDEFCEEAIHVNAFGRKLEAIFSNPE